MKITQIENGTMGENCYLIEEKNDLLIIDPGSEGAKLIQQINESGKKPLAILLTHAHIDHIGAVDDLVDYYHIPFYLSPLEFSFLSDPSLNLSQFFTAPLIVKNKPLPLPEHKLSLGEFEITLLKTPGHSIGGVTYVFPEFAVVGDTLFYESIGRTDFPTGDFKTLMTSITEELFSLPEELPLYPGHGPQTNIRCEAMYNPFLQEEF